MIKRRSNKNRLWNYQAGNFNVTMIEMLKCLLGGRNVQGISRDMETITESNGNVGNEKLSITNKDSVDDLIVDRTQQRIESVNLPTEQ